MAKPLKAIADALTRGLEIVMVLCMVVMLAMVFGNVILRLFFNSGIDLSEEIPRYAFVWMTFLGAIVGMRRRAHLGVDMLVRALPALGRRICWGISQAVMLVCCGYIVYGTWLQHDIIAGTSSPVAQISTLWVFGVSYLTGGAIGLICLSNLVRLVAGKVEEGELIDVHEEGMSEALEAEREMVGQQARSGARP
ncbi:TRAP-type C4-dicarboxylate transport system permease small subunit [Variovorax beijingensis]|jgi:TRAP-type C4-dicarboxylate transport system, small permease component|uniref:TRAP transporter small permease protein n=1 Tax=Variovorax beijingensis TaxID=2496117 RepID=A0A561BC43_9BURK|nr:TRAP transporter small permease [Variovorax beijingensis]TWD76481.1 TRAP-type C4-dicarboxylate transport system permease small subunit [Variovorax beijingensis]